MPIVFSSPNIIPEKKPVNFLSSFNALRQKAVEEQKKIVEEPIISKTQQSSKTGSTGVLKPKYLENKSVFYKESSYIKDLLGEGN